MPSAVEHENILIAIDDSAATWRAVDYVADLGRTSQRLCVHLFHADSTRLIYKNRAAGQLPTKRKKLRRSSSVNNSAGNAACKGLRRISSIRRAGYWRELAQLLIKFNVTWCRWPIVKS